MKVHFTIKGKNNPTNIVCRFKPLQKWDFSCATGIWINREDWSEKKREVKQRADIKNKDLINQKLKELDKFIIEEWQILTLNNDVIYKNWLKDKVNKFFNRAKTNEQHKIYFTDYIKWYLEHPEKHINKGKRISERTIKKHKSTYNKLVEYEQYKDERLRHKDINIDFYNSFLDYCRNVLKWKDNTTGKHISNIKKFCRKIELDGLPISQQFKSSEFVSVTNETKDIYLNEDEINTIFNHDFSASIRLDNARDLFIIGLRTGLRISDFMRLETMNIEKGYIKIKTQKTDAFVVIPIHQQVKQILEKRNGDLPHSISNQKFNLYIKEICQIIGLNEPTEGAKINPKTKRKENGTFEKWELITSHTCRRSFASNLYGKLPNGTIMGITGHKTERAFLKYIKITPEENAKTLERFWAEKQNEQGYMSVLIAE